MIELSINTYIMSNRFKDLLLRNLKTPPKARAGEFNGIVQGSGTLSMPKFPHSAKIYRGSSHGNFQLTAER